ncbi:MAG TPA: hypothetical protein DDX92_08885 [Flavobacteriales bacterium]|jgi:hypothetical protein|nr:hypothetical protein [Flavobacteriales bacterium]
MLRVLFISILSFFVFSSCTVNKYYVQEGQPSSFLYSNELPGIPSFEDTSYTYYEENYYVTPIDEKNAQEQLALSRKWDNSITTPTLNWSIGFQAFPYAFSPCGYNPYGLSLGVSFGNPWLYDPWRNPYMTWRFRSINHPMFYSSRFWSPFYPDPFYAHSFYDPFCNTGAGFGFYDPFYYDPFYFSSYSCPSYYGPGPSVSSGYNGSSNTGGRNLGYQHPITQYTVIKVPNSAGDGNGGSNEGKNPTKPKYTPKIHEAPPPNNIAINPSPGSSSPKVKNRFNQVATQEKSKNQDLNTQIPTVATDPRFAPEKEPEKKNYSYSRPVKSNSAVKKYSSSYNHQKNTTERRGSNFKAISRQPTYRQPTNNRPTTTTSPSRSYRNTSTPSRNDARPATRTSRPSSRPAPSRSSAPRATPSRPSSRPTPSRSSTPRATPSRPSSRPTPSRPSTPRATPTRPRAASGSGIKPR